MDKDDARNESSIVKGEDDTVFEWFRFLMRLVRDTIHECCRCAHIRFDFFLSFVHLMNFI